MAGKPLNHRGTFFRDNGNKSPKYRFSEITAFLGISHMQLVSLISKHQDFPMPAISIGSSRAKPGGTKLYAEKNYYDRDSVVAWYKKVTAEA